jgi:hypothetical protein
MGLTEPISPSILRAWSAFLKDGRISVAQKSISQKPRGGYMKKVIDAQIVQFQAQGSRLKAEAEKCFFMLMKN